MLRDAVNEKKDCITSAYTLQEERKNGKLTAENELLIDREEQFNYLKLYLNKFHQNYKGFSVCCEFM